MGFQVKEEVRGELLEVIPSLQTIRWNEDRFARMTGQAEGQRHIEMLISPSELRLDRKSPLRTSTIKSVKKGIL